MRPTRRYKGFREWYIADKIVLMCRVYRSAVEPNKFFSEWILSDDSNEWSPYLSLSRNVARVILMGMKEGEK